jgi:ferredoxin-thioredoxin reductase catalytic subunit
MDQNERTLKDLEEIAHQNGWILNPKGQTVQNILRAQNNLIKKLGKPYCPCKPKRVDENLCPCKDAQKEINEEGHCHCDLFYHKLRSNKISDMF